MSVHRYLLIIDTVSGVGGGLTVPKGGRYSRPARAVNKRQENNTYREHVTSQSTLDAAMPLHIANLFILKSKKLSFCMFPFQACLSSKLLQRSYTQRQMAWASALANSDIPHTQIPWSANTEPCHADWRKREGKERFNVKIIHPNKRDSMKVTGQRGVLCGRTTACTDGISH